MTGLCADLMDSHIKHKHMQAVPMDCVELHGQDFLVYISHFVVLLYPGKVFLLYRTLDCFKDKLSITTVIFIRSEKSSSGLRTI